MSGVDVICAAIRRGLRFVALPKAAPVRIGVVIEYAGCTVRREIEVGEVSP